VHAENAYNTRYQTNDYGFRNREPVIQPKPEGALRVITYGGSTTFCYNLPYEDTWPARLERLLREHHDPKDQVLNGGAIAWSLGHALARARRDIPLLKPDYVIIYSGINEDLNSRALAVEGVSLAQRVDAGDFGKYATNLEQNQWLGRNVVLVKLLDHLLAPWIQGAKLGMAPAMSDQDVSEEPDPVILENYLQTLQRFLGLARENGAVAVFVVQTHGRNNRMNRYLTSYSRAAITIARAGGAQVVDAEKLVAARGGEPMDLFTASGVHYSALGADRLAHLIFEETFAPGLESASGHSR
jgi:lysophospholipase L1-like esterase